MEYKNGGYCNTFGVVFPLTGKAREVVIERVHCTYRNEKTLNVMFS